MHLDHAETLDTPIGPQALPRATGRERIEVKA
jgi:hypothetical protein